MAKTLTGVVVSDRGDKTIVVSVTTHKNHPLYRKAYVTSKKFMAHDEKNEAKQGDTVVIAETKPLSARKRHTLYKVVERAAITAAESVEAVTAEPVIEKKVKQPIVKKAEKADEDVKEADAKTEDKEEKA